MALNPYEPPQSDDPLTRIKLAKRGIGAGVILLLTPVAVGITIACSCAAVGPVMNLPGVDLSTAILRGYAVAYVPPAIVLIAMIFWALWAFTRDH